MIGLKITREGFQSLCNSKYPGVWDQCVEMPRRSARKRASEMLFMDVRKDLLYRKTKAKHEMRPETCGTMEKEL
ncbi:hypothetical protein BCON_0262g00060 [Botryotinia convoluta]|uniref:Uncharacterized protein n=1 Tax=Botryotinia convoluta TaxID=54673 RepID=A0A4Z1HM65_9HELO|nr:hypothetical protein BCON_0262g00060 [Botryotinia convoluta]